MCGKSEDDLERPEAMELKELAGRGGQVTGIIEQLARRMRVALKQLLLCCVGCVRGQAVFVGSQAARRRDDTLRSPPQQGTAAGEGLAGGAAEESNADAPGRAPARGLASVNAGVEPDEAGPHSDGQLVRCVRGRSACRLPHAAGVWCSGAARLARVPGWRLRGSSPFTLPAHSHERPALRLRSRSLCPPRPFLLSTRDREARRQGPRRSVPRTTRAAPATRAACERRRPARGPRARPPARHRRGRRRQQGRRRRVAGRRGAPGAARLGGPHICCCSGRAPVPGCALELGAG